MTIRFAAAGHPPRLYRAGLPCPPPANDNAAPVAIERFPSHALRHFAAHGLDAVAAARRRAEEAFFAGDRAAYHHWLGVCRSFDRRLARSLSDSFDSHAG